MTGSSPSIEPAKEGGGYMTRRKRALLAAVSAVGLLLALAAVFLIYVFSGACKLTLQFNDPEGRPVPGIAVTVSFDTDYGDMTLRKELAPTDGNGETVWEDFFDRTVTVKAEKDGVVREYTIQTKRLANRAITKRFEFTFAG